MVRPQKVNGPSPQRTHVEAPAKSPFKAQLSGFQKFISFFIPPLKGYFIRNAQKEAIFKNLKSVDLIRPLIEKYNETELSTLYKATEIPAIKSFLDSVGIQYKDNRKEGIKYLQKILLVIASADKEELKQFKSRLEKLSTLFSDSKINLSKDDQYHIIRFLLENLGNERFEMSLLPKLNEFFAHTKLATLKELFSQVTIISNPQLREILLDIYLSRKETLSRDEAISIAKFGSLFIDDQAKTYTLLPVDKITKDEMDLATISPEMVEWVKRNFESVGIFSSETEIAARFLKDVPAMFKVTSTWEGNQLKSTFETRAPGTAGVLKRDFTFTIPRGMTKSQAVKHFSDSKEIEKALLLFKADYLKLFK